MDSMASIGLKYLQHKELVLMSNTSIDNPALFMIQLYLWLMVVNFVVAKTFTS